MFRQCLIRIIGQLALQIAIDLSIYQMKTWTAFTQHVIISTPWPLIYLGNFLSNFSNWWLVFFLWNCPPWIVTGSDWNVNTSSGLMSAITWANIELDLYSHMASLGHSEFKRVSKSIDDVWYQVRYDVTSIIGSFSVTAFARYLVACSLRNTYWSQYCFVADYTFRKIVSAAW